MKKCINFKENYSSQNLYEKVILLSEIEKQKIIKGLNFIINSRLNMVLVGGMAVVHHLKTNRVLTPDVDILVSDMDKLKELLYRHNIKYNNLNNNLGITVDEFNTDFLDSQANNKKLNKVILSTPNIAKIAGYSINIINPELLFIMKMETSRDKDIDDAINIIKSGILSKQVFLKYCFNEYDCLVGYAEMM